MSGDIYKLMTAHPGGWKDITEALRACKAVFVIRTIEMNAVVGDVTATRDVLPEYKLINAAQLADYLESLTLDDYKITGLLATHAGTILSSAGLPSSGSKEWSKPALTWERLYQDGLKPEDMAKLKTAQNRQLFGLNNSEETGEPRPIDS